MTDRQEGDIANTDPKPQKLTSKMFLAKIEGKGQMGPMTADELRTLASSGKLGREDLVSVENENKWVAASSVQGLEFEHPKSESVDDANKLETRPRNSSKRKRQAWILTLVSTGLAVTIIVTAMAIVKIDTKTQDPLASFENFVDCFTGRVASYQEDNWDFDQRYLYFDNFDVQQTDSLRNPIGGVILGMYRHSAFGRYIVEVNCEWSGTSWSASTVTVQWNGESGIISPSPILARDSVTTALEESGATTCGGP